MTWGTFSAHPLSLPLALFPDWPAHADGGVAMARTDRDPLPTSFHHRWQLCVALCDTWKSGSRGGVEGEFVATVRGQSEVAGVVVLKLFQKAVNMYANVALVCHNLII